MAGLQLHPGTLRIIDESWRFGSDVTVINDDEYRGDDASGLNGGKAASDDLRLELGQ
ncbi:type II secretion system protein [Sesbania bispinosa]|nr:type II secretion system protein [Sesbania bispinosa]